MRSKNLFGPSPEVLRWLLIAVLVGVLSGTASAALLFLLDWATETREANRWIIALLPLAGLGVGLLYRAFGRSVEAGNNLLLEEIHEPKSVVPFRMTPLVLFGTTVSHLFGASVGREGTALQTGASLADQLSRPLRLGPEDRRIVLMAGMSGGFGSVFGTPLAGAVFGLEVLAIGKLRYDALLPCLVAAVVGDRVTHAWGAHHTVYSVPFIPPLDLTTLGATILAGIVFGFAGRLFAKLTHGIGQVFANTFRRAPVRPFVGGMLVALVVWATGSTRYLGLGIPTILDAFSGPLPWWDSGAKMLLTSLSIGSGFKGGEVTPLFFMGATLGNALSSILPLPLPLLAGMGFVAVFAGAANTPLASTLMAVEMFGPGAGIFAGIACVVSYLFSGHSGIYQAQRIGLSKTPFRAHEEGLPLALVTQYRNLSRPDLFADIHPLGFFNWSDHPPMNQLAVLRLYFHAEFVVAEGSFLRRIFPRPLGRYLLTKAQEAGIEQAILHPVFGGFLRGDRLAFGHSDVVPAKLPQCLELIDDPEILRKFVELNQRHLTEVRMVMLRGETLELDLEGAPKHV